MYAPNFLDGFDRLVAFDAETTGKRTPSAEFIRKQPFAWKPPGLVIEVGFVEMLRDGGTYVEMGQFTDAGSIQTSWHRICTKDLNVLGSWGFTGNDLPLGVDMLYRTRHKYPWLEMQTLYPFSEEGIGRAVADAMAMKTVKSTIVPWPELAE